MPDILDKVAQLAQTAVERLHVKSALNPALWLCGISTPICFIFAYAFRDAPDVRNWLLIGGFCPIAVACFGFIGFAIFRPEKLQSEEYQIRHESLQIIQQRSGRIEIEPASIEAIANPEAKSRSHKGDTDA